MEFFSAHRLILSYICTKFQCKSLYRFKYEGSITCDFTSLLTVFHFYQDSEGLIMKGYVQWNPVYVEKISPRVGFKLGIARSVVVVLFCYIHGKHLRSCRDGQLT